MTSMNRAVVPLKELDDSNAIAHAAAELRRNEPRARIEFTVAVKKILGDRAGWKCSYHGCLRDTTGPTENEERKSVSARAGVASHIHAAREGGPRWNASLSEEEIKDVNNGIWLCTHHGNVIDVFIKEHPPEKLVAMKQVRDFAQQITMLDENVGHIVTRVGVQWLDNVVWKHWPNPDLDAVRSDLAQLAAALERNARLGTVSAALPATFPLKKVVTEVKAAVADTVSQMVQATSADFLAQASFQRERRRAVAIARAWERPQGDESLVECARRRLWCNVKLSARDPETGALCDDFIWARGTGEIRHEYSLEQGEWLEIHSAYTVSRKNNLDWHLDVVIRDGRCRVDSTLRVFTQLSDVDVHDYFVWKALEGYGTVVEKMSQGWTPIGFVGLDTGGNLDADAIHPEPFEIKSKVTAQELEECLYRYRKLKLGKEIAEEWGFVFIPTDAFFCRELDEATIMQAADTIAEQSGPAPYWYNSRSKPLVTLPGKEIRLTVRNFCLSFRSMPVKKRH